MQIHDVQAMSRFSVELGNTDPRGNSAKPSAGSALPSDADRLGDTTPTDEPAAGHQAPSPAMSFVSNAMQAGSSVIVIELGGQYIASVPAPPGLSASGVSAQDAENKLQMVLDVVA